MFQIYGQIGYKTYANQEQEPLLALQLLFHTSIWAPQISPASAEKWKYALLELAKNNQSFKIFLNVKPVLQKAWPLVPNYFQPLYKEWHSFLEDDIFLNQRKINLLPECRNDNLLSKESNGEKSRDHLWLQDFARAAISLLKKKEQLNQILPETKYKVHWTWYHLTCGST